MKIWNLKKVNNEGVIENLNCKRLQSALKKTTQEMNYLKKVAADLKKKGMDVDAKRYMEMAKGLQFNISALQKKIKAKC